MASRFFKTIATFEIVGGIMGPAGVAYQLSTTHSTWADWIAGVVMTAIYIFALFAGLALWRDQRSGYVRSMIVQIIQLPKILSVKVAFMMSFGFDVSALLVSDPPNGFGLQMSVKLLFDDMLRFGDHSMPYALGISLVSCVFLLALIDTFFRKKSFGVA